MPDPNKALDALTQWQSETRQQIINEIGSAIMKALEKIGYQIDADSDHVVRAPRRRKRRRAKSANPKQRKLRPGTDMERVFNIIKAHPGNKGHQIQALLATNGAVVHERTMRTCLNRLKTRGYIKQHADRAWYTVEVANE
jgi:hypothetical protein